VLLAISGCNQKPINGPCEMIRVPGVDDVLFGSRLVTVAWHLLELITVGKGSILGQPAPGPTPMGNSVFDGEIEGRPVRSRLSSGLSFQALDCLFWYSALDLLKLCEKPLPA
jgi:hypothetical protein